jgi:hypothetical protein
MPQNHLIKWSSLGSIVALIIFFLLLSGSPLTAQIQGSLSEVSFPGSRDYGSRISSFYYENQYYVAYNLSDSSNPFSVKYAPALYWGLPSIPAGSQTLKFQNAQKVDILSPNAGKNNTNTWHMAAGLVAGIPYIFQFNCSKDSAKTLQSISYEKVIPGKLQSDPPTFSKTIYLPSSIVSEIGNVQDVAVTTMGPEMVMFIARANPSDIVALRFNGYSTPVFYPELNFTGSVNANIQSIDATNVTLLSGQQEMVIAAVTLDSYDNSHVTAWMWNGTKLTSAINGTSLTQPDYEYGTDNKYTSSQFSSPAVRLAYGPATGLPTVNSCTVFFGGTPVNAAPYFFPTLMGTQLELPTSSTAGGVYQSTAWSVLDSSWIVANDDPFPYNWTAFTAAIPGPSYQSSPNSTAPYNYVGQYITLVQCGQNEMASGDTNNLMTSSLALELRPTAGSTGIKSYPSSHWNDYTGAGQKSVVQGWNLLGIITGVPPLPEGTVVSDTDVLSISYLNSGTSATSQVSNTSVGVSGSIGTEKVVNVSASAGYSYASKVGTKTSNTFSLNLNISFPPPANASTYDNVSDLGYLIVSEPVYYSGTYEVYAYDGITDFGISTFSIWASGGNITAIPFYLDSPNTPIAGYPTSVYSFPTDSNGDPLVSWPLITDITAWEKNSPPTLPSLTNIKSLFQAGSSPQNINGAQTQNDTLTITASELNENSTQTTNKIDIGAGLKFLGIGASTSDSLALTSSLTTSFSSSTGIEIAYPVLSAAQGYKQITIEPILDVKHTQSAESNWIPTIFQGSSPWLLSWQVLSDVPASN